MQQHQSIQSSQLPSNRKKKLSKWVKKIMQPARDAQALTVNTSSHEHGNSGRTHASQTTTPNQRRHHTVKPMSEAKVQNKDLKRVLQWDEEPQRQRERSLRSGHSATVQDVISATLQHGEDESMANDSDDDDDNSSSDDYASMAPLMSFCSSSVKSCTFSDMHSMQSTRPTVMSARTIETNSSTVAIPPASILDRARATPTINHSAAASIASSRPPSSKHFSLQRHNSSHTVNSIITIKS